MAKQMLIDGKEIDHDLAAAIVAQVHGDFREKLEKARAQDDQDLMQAYAFVVNAIFNHVVASHTISGRDEYTNALGIEFA